MPRRRNLYGSSPRRTKSAPPVIKIVAPKLDVSGLIDAYDCLAFNRTLGLQLASEWYAKSTPVLLYGNPLSADLQKTFDRAVKAKQLGDGSINNRGVEGEIHQAYTTALRLYEKLWADSKNLPRVDAKLNSIDAGTLSKSASAIRTVIENMNAAFGSWLKFNISFDSERTFEPGTVTLPHAEISAMAANPPLQTVLREASEVAKVVSVVTNSEGKQELDGEKFFVNLPLVLDSVYNWAATQNGNLTRPVYKQAAGSTPKVRTANPNPTVVNGTAPRTRAGKIGLTAVLHTTGSKTWKGKRAYYYAEVKDGQTYGDYLNAHPKEAKEFLKWYIQQGAVTVEQ